jgi:hypothetical protein
MFYGKLIFFQSLQRLGLRGQCPCRTCIKDYRRICMSIVSRRLERLHAEMEEQWWDMFYFNGYLRQRNDHRRVAEFQSYLHHLVFSNA